ncbi:hypothetical protein CY34DRAFT_811534 [Suillus luteus UH-Slu-Lm8-n1]|uniref:Uncharacterized protein n=1 Tax=Suillus luteus UH-Slu-Lm8-n1 TaxID=930992 RepID=A0A0D0ADC7_9AGAM|nr:hypothetical protein CY34DRAFT_811534 [Suillus luteus UH-Slu-Lm8-n1]
MGVEFICAGTELELGCGLHTSECHPRKSMSDMISMVNIHDSFNHAITPKIRDVRTIMGY